MSEHQKRVAEFMVKADQDLPTFPSFPDRETRLLRAKLILEEALETIEALGFLAEVVIRTDRKMNKPLFIEHDRGCNIVEVADGCADLRVVTTGTALAFGIDLEPIQEAVDNANLDKFRGDAHRREDGKWVKPSDWVAPDIMGLLKQQGYEG